MSSFEPVHRLVLNAAEEKLQKARNTLGDETIVEQLLNYFDTDTATWFLEKLDDDYDLGLFDDIDE